MRDTAWRDALILVPGRVAGFRLRPLSAWHMHALQMTDNPCADVWADRGPTPGDLCDAIAVCRSRPGVLLAAGRMMRIALWLRWQFKDWRMDALAMRRHINAFNRRPEVVQTKDGGQPLGCPPYFAIALDVAMLVPSITLCAALDLPICQLQTIRTAANELTGGARCAWGSGAAIDSEGILDALRTAQAAIDRHAAAEKAGAADGR